MEIGGGNWTGGGGDNGPPTSNGLISGTGGRVAVMESSTDGGDTGKDSA